MGDQPTTRADLKCTAALTTTLTALNVQIAALITKGDDIANNKNNNANNNYTRNNLNRGGERIPVIR
ncbi:hypothetical protein L195_g062363, partial [Trifolium pratense]